MPMMRSADTNRDGRVDRAEARAAFDSLFPGVGGLGARDSKAKAVVRAFRVTKRQKKGSKYQHWLQAKRARWEWQRIWRLFDMDNDEKLSKAELLRVEQVSLPERTQL